MKSLYVAALLSLSMPAQAVDLPPCYPHQLGSTGSDFKRGETAEAEWLGWTCTRAGKETVYGVVSLKTYTIVHPDVTGLSPTKAAAAYWAANVTDVSDPRLSEARVAMKAAFGQ